MRIFTRGAIFCWLTWLACAATQAAEDKLERQKSDQTQAQYTRKSITYLGLELAPGVSLPPEALPLIARGIRPQVELPRFDYNALDLKGFASLAEFVEALRGYVLKSSVDRAGAEAEYSARFQRANVLAADIERVLASAYLYRIQVRGFAADPWVCRDKLVEEEYEEEEPAKNPGEQPRRVKKTRTRKQEECFAGGPTAWSDRPRMRVTLATAVLFDKANLQGQGEPLVSPVCALGAQGSGEAPYPAPPRPPEKPERSAYPSHEAYDRALAQYEEALAEHQRQLALYRERVPQLQREATLKTIPGLAARIPITTAQVMAMGK